MIFKYHFILLHQGFSIMRCYIYKVLTMRLRRHGANSSASCEGRGWKSEDLGIMKRQVQKQVENKLTLKAPSPQTAKI